VTTTRRSGASRRRSRRAAAAQAAQLPKTIAPSATRADAPPIVPSPLDEELHKPSIASPPEALQAQPHPAFAHASEAEMARILDFYQVRWEYEPHTFPIVWNLEGSVVESFSPDFWLPDLDLYLEMTTLRQKLVRKKNRKLRRVLELYPDLRVKLFYARDFRALMLKFGKLALVDELSGTPGQVVPVRPAAADDDGDESDGEREVDR
jgi:hypoxanthine phosphoribosyltransferase